MKDTIKQLPLSLIDFLAVVLPGFIWTISLWVTYLLLFPPNYSINSYSDCFLYICETVASAKSPTMTFFLFLILSLVVGYIVKQNSSKLTQILCTPFFFINLYDSKEYRKAKYGDINEDADNDNIDDNEKSNKDKMSLYKEEYKSKNIYLYQTFYSPLKEAMIKKYSLFSDGDINPKHYFSAAKRFLRFKAEHFWAESEHSEAEVRLFASLFLIFLYNFIANIAIIFGALGDNRDLSKSIFFIILFLLFTILSGTGFRKARAREVRYTYLNTLITLREHSLKPEEHKNGAYD